MISKVKTILSFTLLFLFLSGCRNKAEESNHLISSEQVLVIGVDSITADNIPTLSTIYTALSDKEGNIYIVDQKTQRLHSFNPEGVHRWSIGGEGSGPGEFRGISDIFIDKKNRLIVQDRKLAMMTSYTLSGKKIEEWPSKVGGSGFKEIRQMPDGRFLFPYWNADKNTLIAIYSEDFQEKENSLVKLQEVRQTDSEIEKEILRAKLGCALSLNDSLIAYVPRHYNGKLNLFKKLSNGQWTKNGVIAGHRNIEPSITIHKPEDGSHERSLLSGFNPEGGYYATEFYSMSYGLYPYDNDSIIHLSYDTKGENEWRLVLELFDKEKLKLEDYYIVSDLDITNYSPEIIPLWFDQKGNIYLRDNRNTPKLRVLNVDL